MHTCRLKAGFPTIFGIMSAKSEGGVKYICVSKSNLIIYVADYYTYTYMLKCRLNAAFHTRFVNFNACKDSNILSNNFHCRFYIHLMHTCRRKAGFSTIFEIMSAKREGAVKYICVSKSNLIIYIADYFIYTYMHTCRLKAAFHTRFV